MLRAQLIEKSYGPLQVLKGVSLELAAGEVCALAGASGAGKSTLLQILGTLDTPDGGSVWLDDEEVTKFSPDRQARYRNLDIGFVFQFHHLLPEFSALENVAIPALIAGQREREVLARAHELLARLGLGDKHDSKPANLSGGEAQRVAMARALINKPRFVLADEPTGNLDTANGEALFELMQAIARESGTGFLMVTHNDSFAARADRCVRMRDGLILS